MPREYEHYDIFEQFDRMKTELGLVRQNQEEMRKKQRVHDELFSVLMKRYHVTSDEKIEAEGKTLC